MSELPQKFQCPNCFVSVRVPEQGEAVTCRTCGTRLEVIGHLCADCATYHEKGVPLCATCATPMTKVCRRCRTVNWAGNSHCVACEAGLDVIETLLDRSTEGTTAVVRQQMDESHTIKWQETLSSAERMEELNEKEAARQAEIQRREGIIREQERQMWLKVGVIITLVVLLIIFVILLA